MKNSGEAKLLLIMAAFVVIGGGAMVIINRGNSGGSSFPLPIPGASPTAPAGPNWDDTKWKTITENPAHVMGPNNAPFTMVEFADFECPSCRKTYNDSLKQLEKTGRIRLIFHHFPWTFHVNALPAALASEAAGRQGKFWPMYDALFNKEEVELNDNYLTNMAKDIHLDTVRFDRDREDPEVGAIIETDHALGQRMGVNSTPTIVIRDNKTGKIYQAVGAPDVAKMMPFITGKTSTPPPMPAATTGATTAP